MYSALLVDDEPAVLDVLLNVIPWAQLGVSQLFTAADGKQALNIFQNSNIDLLITDIRMPEMDGLALLEKVHTLYPYTHCILLTAYDEFEYAKAALQLGVENYILKPFQQEELESTIEKALDNLYLEKENNVWLFRNNILMRWVNNAISENELSERALYLDINIYCKNYCAVCFRKLHKCSLMAYAEQLKILSGNVMEIQHFWNDSDICVFIIGGHNLKTDSIRDLFSAATENLQYNGLFLAACGSIVEGCANLSQSYREACKNLMTASVQDKDFFIPYEDALSQLETSCCHEISSIFKTEASEERHIAYHTFGTNLLQLTDNNRPESLNLLISGLYQFYEQECPGKEELRTQLYSRITPSSYISSDDFSEAVARILEVEYLSFRYYFEQLNPVVSLAVKYIHTHYSESLSLKEFCVKNKMNSAYLGFLFKKETGMFFNNYLTQYRLLRSFHLLNQTDMEINNIAAAVGFSSPSYYISCFKKQTGLTPIKYRSLKV